MWPWFQGNLLGQVGSIWPQKIRMNNLWYLLSKMIVCWVLLLKLSTCEFTGTVSIIQFLLHYANANFLYIIYMKINKIIFLNSSSLWCYGKIVVGGGHMAPTLPA